jgi:WD40 repeat protein
VAHEALLREWERLRRWVDESRQDLQTERGLSVAVAEWRNAQYDPDYLLVGSRLTQFEDWAAQTDLNLSDEQNGYLAASVAQRETREGEERARLERERALERLSRNALRILAAVLLLATLGSFMLAGVAFTQRQEARANFARAESQRLAAESSRILQVGRSPELAALLAIQALRIAETTQADLALQNSSLAYYGDRALENGAVINMIAFSPDGRYLASGDDDGWIKIWEVASGAVAYEWLAGADQSVYAVQFSPDGRTLFTSGDDIAQLWDIATGAELLTLADKHGGPLYNVRFAPDGRTLASGGGDYVIFWDIATGAELNRLTFEANNLVTAIAYAPDGRHLVSGSYDGVVRLWESASGALVHEMRGHSNIIDAVVFTPDGRYILSGAEDNSARLWDAATGDAVHLLAGHTDLVYSVAVSPNGRYLLTGSWDTTVRLWDAATGAEISRLGSHAGAVLYVAVAPDGRALASTGLDGTIRLWDMAVVERDNFRGHEDWINAIQISPDGQLLVTAADDGQLFLWNAATGARVGALAGHENQIVTAQFTADGRAVLSSSLDGTTRLWDVAAGQEIERFAGGRLAALSPDNQRALIIDVDRTVHRLNLSDGSQRPLENVSGATQIAFAPDGQSYVVGVSGGAQLFDAATDAPGRLLAHNGLSALAYAPDGRWLLTGAQDGSLLLWPLPAGDAPPLRLAGHTSRVWSAAFSPDGAFILTGGEDGLARLWAASDGREARRFGGHGGVVGAVAFSADGRQVFLGGGDGELWTVPLDLQSLITAVCQRTLRDLTAVEQTEYGLKDMAATCP